jgi:hypothetical protein
VEFLEKPKWLTKGYQAIKCLSNQESEDEINFVIRKKALRR